MKNFLNMLTIEQVEYLSVIVEKRLNELKKTSIKHLVDKYSKYTDGELISMKKLIYNNMGNAKNHNQYLELEIKFNVIGKIQTERKNKL